MTRRPATHHQKIVDDVLGNIVSGTWPPGYRIPYESDMANDYGVSRMTVNKALTQLTREGYLQRRRKVGTVVAAPRVQSAVMEIADIKSEVSGAGGTHGYVQLHREVRSPSESDRKHLRLPAGVKTRILALQGLHTAEGLPYCIEDRIIDLAVVPGAEQASFESEPAGSWLLRQVPWSAAQHTIRAVGASASDARLLKLPAGSACLEIERLTQSNGRSVTFARLCYPGDRHQVTASFEPR
jgi:GntR family histidine utilization transcriptional repressor